MSLTCFIIGEGTLLIECATILSRRGALIMGVVSDDPQVRAYCDTAELRCIDSTMPLAPVLAADPFDYLFSIVNKSILPEAVLRLPRLHTINYHDGPLPAYAGVHATFWSLVNGEKMHAITWHLVDTNIDTGAIIIQKQFPIDADETSISLNIKCYAAAIDSFRELTHTLTVNTLTFQPQDVAQRSYYARTKRPDLLINWSMSAAQITRLHRALDFGFHPNPFGFLKIWTADRFWLVRNVTTTKTVSLHPPGTVEAILSDSLLVSTSDFNLTIGTLQTLDGKPVSIAAFCEQTGLTNNDVLAYPEPEIVQAIQEVDRRCSRHQAYWVNKLVHFEPTTLPWAASYKRNNEHKPTIERIDVVLSQTLNKAIELNSIRNEQAHPVLTALLITLARLTNQRSVSVGYRSPQSKQLSTDTAGLFADILPLQIEFDWESGFEQARTQISQEQAIVEANLTFVRESWVSQPALHTRAPEFEETKYPILICLNDVASGCSPEESLMIVLTEEKGGTHQVVFDAGIWSAHWVTELVKRWLTGLENLVSQSDQPLKSVPLLTTEEQNRMLHDWNATAVPYPREESVFQLFEAQVQQRPQAEVVRCGAITLTYEQLNRQANQLARYLQKQGVTSGTLVGLCLDRSPDMIRSLLAILKAGGAYVPLDPGYPTARLTSLITQTGLQHIITRKTELDHLPAENVYVLMDEDQPRFAQESDQNLDIPVNTGQVAYVLFTSGSTGQPKGVAISHRAIGRTVRGANYMRLNEGVSMLGLAPLSFDASTLEIWGTLANGGRLVLIAERIPSLEVIKQTIQSHSINTAFFTAALFNVLVDSGIDGLVTLTQLATGGEAASAEHVLRARKQLPGCELINMYGPTESTILASFYTMSTGSWETGSVPIGTPVSNTQLYIVDSFLNPMPVGVPGELLIGGDGLANEYLHQPELTRQKFIPNPFSDQSGSRLYRTGDQARYLADGTIEFLGRRDDQVKIRGFRIEPGEIEHALCQHPTVGEALVLAESLSTGTKRLVAYVVPKMGAVIQPDGLRDFLKTSLPDYLIPNLLIPLSAIPLTANGKVDKASLPLSFNISPSGQPDLLTPTERAMEPLWASVLHLPTLNRSANFFDLGGSSLMSMQLISLISQTFGLRLSMRDVFNHPTLHQLSSYVDGLPRQEVLSLDPYSIETDDVRQFPLSSAQNRLWILEQLQALEGTYNVPIVLRIEGDLNRSVLQESLNEIIRRHDILRTSFGHTNGIPFQKIAPDFSLNVPISSHLMGADVKSSEALTKWITGEAYQLFDLTSGPLMRVTVAQLGVKSWILLMNFHHIIFDGLSTRVLANELSVLYTAGVQKRSALLPPLPIQYVDYARWQANSNKPETLNAERAYWKNHLAGVPPLINLPIDKPRPAIQSFAGADYSFLLHDELWKRLRYTFQEPGTTVFLRLLTVFAVWLQQATQTSEIVIGIPISGRNRAELEALIGFFVNTLVLRIPVSTDHSFRHLLRTVRQLTLEAYDHQALSFDEVVGEVKPIRSLSYAPLVQVLFDFQEDYSVSWTLDDLQVEQEVFQQQRAKFDLTLSVQKTPESLLGTFTYRTDLFDESTIATMADQFIKLTDQLLAQPDQSLTYLFNSGATSLIAAERINAPSHPEPVLQPLNDSLVHLLKQIWCQLLEVPAVDLDEDFFNLGGHSLLAVQLIAAIQQQVNCSLPVTSIFANPTLRQLAQYIQTSQPDMAWQSLVTVKTADEGKPLFLVHHLSGDVGYVYQVSPYLSEHQSLFGLQAVGLDGITEPLSSIEEIAAYYVRLIINKQPVGPYSIGGFSLGGIIAFEMARQLKRSGKVVNLVALIDAYPLNPDIENHAKFPIRQLLTHYYHHWRSFPKHPSVLLPILFRKIPWASRYLFGRFWHLLFTKADVVASNTTEMNPPEPPSPLTISLLKAYSQYEFKPYDGKVVFLRVTNAETYGSGRSNVDFGWGRYARNGVDVYHLVGKHESLFTNTATIEQIGRILQSYLTP